MKEPHTMPVARLLTAEKARPWVVWADTRSKNKRKTKFRSFYIHQYSDPTSRAWQMDYARFENNL